MPLPPITSAIVCAAATFVPMDLVFAPVALRPEARGSPAPALPPTAPPIVPNCWLQGAN